MSDDTDFEKIKGLLLDINTVVTQMDPAVRVATFEMLAARYIVQKAPCQPKSAPEVKVKGNAGDSGSIVDTNDLGTFISSFDTSKPHEALNVLAAWLYSQRGSQLFTTSELKELADQCGLTIPSRPDMTFKGAKTNGKAIYAQSGRSWKLTVSGEMHVKSTYNVTKGSVSSDESQ